MFCIILEIRIYCFCNLIQVRFSLFWTLCLAAKGRADVFFPRVLPLICPVPECGDGSQ